MSDYSELKRLAENDSKYATRPHWNAEQMRAAGASDDEAEYIAAAKSELILSLIAENESLRKDAERYQWLASAKRLILKSDGMRWTRSNGDMFVSSHMLCAFDTQYAPHETLDETIDAAISSPENPS